jgi:transcriptional regulator with XRE-family HTH domain
MMYVKLNKMSYMQLAALISRRLKELDVDQRALAQAAEVTDSYISQLLSGNRRPPAPRRTDIYEKMNRFLRLPAGELARVAEQELREELTRAIGATPAPLFADTRALVLRKCSRRIARAVTAIFARAPYGELERLVTQKLVEVAQEVAAQKIANEAWLRSVTQNTGRRYRQLRVLLMEFLELTPSQVSLEDYGWFVEPLIDEWEVDLDTLELSIRLNRKKAGGATRRFAFQEKEIAPAQPKGLRQFQEDRKLSGDATAEELHFLQRLRFTDRQPTKLFYYRTLQSLRDPLHFEGALS